MTDLLTCFIVLAILFIWIQCIKKSKKNDKAFLNKLPNITMEEWSKLHMKEVKDCEFKEQLCNALQFFIFLITIILLLTIFL